MSTFISYSRVNSEFVVRLAKDLKAAGYDVWLDQLDIPKGARWDDAIEAAVERSSTFMIVLAPESIESQNVKDELSYAIDSGKQILPVVIQPCKIPLRLRRFQYVDFTNKPYKDSLADIKHLLSKTRRREQPAAHTPSAAPEEALAEPPSEPHLQSTPHHEPVPLPPRVEMQAEPATSRKFLLPAVLAVLAIAALGAAVVFAGNRNSPAPLPTATSTQGSPATDTATVAGFAIPVQVIDQTGVTMRLVSAGDFLMGSDRGMPDEKPERTFYLDEFYIDKYEVTNAFYSACVKAGVCEAPKPGKTSARVAYFGDSNFDNYPVVDVDWNMARTYCEWRGARLPTELEWEKAARGPDGRTYPWGEEISCNQANYFGCQGEIDSVSRFENGLSIYGVQNMAGNVAEWVSSLYAAYPYDITDGREDLEAVGERVIRGGSWINADSDNEVRASHRQKADPATANESIGFRCARTPDYLIADTGQAVLTPQNAFTATAIAVQQRSTKVRDSNAIDPSIPVFAGASTSAVLASSTAAADATPVLIAPSQISAEPPTDETPIIPTNTDVPPTPEPPTDVPPTDIPPTDIPPTDVPPTDLPPTDVPTDPPAISNPTQPPVVE